jgi:DNA primase
VVLPAGADPGELIVREGADALRERIAASVPYVVFQVGRVLDAADLSGAEGKDRAIAALRPVFDGVQESVLRDELVRKAASTLELPEARLVTLLGAGSGSASAGRPGSAGRVTPPDSGERFSEPSPGRPSVAAAPRRQRPEPERSFLAMCVAAPDLGAAELARIDPDALLLDDVLRRAARFLGAHLPGDLPDPDGDDPELIFVLDDLRARAQRGRRVSADELEHARLVLERDRLRREIRYMREHGGEGGALAKLSAQQQQVLTSIRAVVTRLEGTG